jgi:hypothetical protein
VHEKSFVPFRTYGGTACVAETDVFSVGAWDRFCGTVFIFKGPGPVKGLAYVLATRCR